ncbi:MAG: thioesterase family protein [Dehalococcoidia bacterium]
MGTSVIRIKVRGYHVDIYGHVNNARYLEFLEEARWEFAEGTLDLRKWQGQGIGFSVVNININYRKPAFIGDVLEIQTGVAHLGRASGTIHQKIFRGETDEPVADADVKFVMVDSATGKAIPMEGEIRTAFELLIRPGQGGS